MVPRGHDSCDVRLCQGKLKMHIKSNCFYGISNSHSGLQMEKLCNKQKLVGEDFKNSKKILIL